jgi:hypothetical protein
MWTDFWQYWKTKTEEKKASKMKKQKVGLALFWISVIWMIAWLIISKGLFGPLLHSLTTDEINQTIWAFTGPLNLLSGISLLLGAIIAGVGILLYAGAKGSTVWKVGIGLFSVLILALVATGINFYSAPLFGIGGAIILLSFLGVLWLLAKQRMALGGSSTTAADFKLVGYVFMFMAAWFLCGKAVEGFAKGLEGLPTMSMMNILILLVMGWFFLCLSDYKSRPQ